jgi:excisionase family DNA binding protein
VTKWITQREAGEILGVHKSRVAKLVAKGALQSRGGRQASLDCAQVVALAEWRAGAPQRAQEAREQRAAARKAAQRWGKPPDDEHEWLGTSDVAQLLGVSRVAVNQRINRGRLPFTEHGGRRWIRRDLLELVERAREATRRGRA